MRPLLLLCGHHTVYLTPGNNTGGITARSSYFSCIAFVKRSATPSPIRPCRGTGIRRRATAHHDYQHSLLLQSCLYQNVKERRTLHCRPEPNHGTVPDEPEGLRVENNGFEPLTPCLQSRCSSQLS